MFLMSICTPREAAAGHAAAALRARRTCARRHQQCHALHEVVCPRFARCLQRAGLGSGRHEGSVQAGRLLAVHLRRCQDLVGGGWTDRNQSAAGARETPTMHLWCLQAP